MSNEEEELDCLIIIKNYLEKNGYDGLCRAGCACSIKTGLAECWYNFRDCEPGHIATEEELDNLEHYNVNWVLPGKRGVEHT